MVMHWRLGLLAGFLVSAAGCHRTPSFGPNDWRTSPSAQRSLPM